MDPKYSQNLVTVSAFTTFPSFLSTYPVILLSPLSSLGEQTSRHVNAVNKLVDFWSMKSVYLRLKTKPELADDPVRQEHILSYFSKYTDIGQCYWWQCLSKDEQLKCVKQFRIQEIKDKAVRIIPETAKAEIYLVLQGTAMVTQGFTSEVPMEEGTLFGSLDLFDQVTNYHRWRTKRDPEPTFDRLPPMKEGKDIIIGTYGVLSFIMGMVYDVFELLFYLHRENG